MWRLSFAFLLVPWGSLAAQPVEVSTIAGWFHEDGETPGIDLSGGRVTYSSPVIAEVDGNAANGKETVAAGFDGKIYAYHADGSLLWEAESPPSECAASRSRILSSPAVGDLDGDGTPSVVIGYGGLTKRCDGGVIALNGATGDREWRFSTKAFLKREKVWAILHAVFSTPALADVNGDGKMEVGFGSFDRNVYLLNFDGSIRFYYLAADTVWSSPAFANVDSTPELEMIIGTDMTKNTRLNPPTHNGGMVYAFRTAQNPKKRFGFRDKRAFLWMRPLDQTVFSAPSIGDVIPSNPGAEVVVASGCYFPERVSNKRGKWVKVLSARTGKVLRTLPTQACSSSSPAIADVNGDGVGDVVTTVNGHRSVGGDGKSRITVFNADSGQEIWSVIPKFEGRGYSWGGNFASAVSADLNGDGSLEVLASTAAGIGIFRGVDGTPLSCQDGGCDDLPSLDARDVVLSSPAIGDIDGDGQPEVVAAGVGASGGALYGWKGFVDVLPQDPGPHPPFSMPWPMFRGDALRRGR